MSVLSALTLGHESFRKERLSFRHLGPIKEHLVTSHPTGENAAKKKENSKTQPRALQTPLDFPTCHPGQHLCLAWALSKPQGPNWKAMRQLVVRWLLRTALSREVQT